jgi:hypothetical protein
MQADALDPTVSGVVDEIDNDLARVLIGDDQAEWFFPLSTLPPGAKVGSDILFSTDNGRYAVIGFARGAAFSNDRSIEDRLSRPLSRRRTLEMHVSDSPTPGTDT